MNNLTDIQNKFVSYIEKIMMSNKLSHAYLIEMEDSSTEFPLVLLFVKMILCPLEINKCDKLNCSKCNVCRLIDEKNFPDFEIIEADGNQIKKNQLLELKDEFQKTSLIGKRRVYVIKDAEKLNPSSANTILKFLEEPEENIIAILLTRNRYQVLDTILSRCQILALNDASMVIRYDDEIALFLKYLFNGKDLFIHYKEILDNILVDKNKAKEVFEQVEKIILGYLGGKLNSDYDLTIFKEIEKKTLLKYVSIIEEEIPKLVYNINYKLWLDSIYTRFVEVC